MIILLPLLRRLSFRTRFIIGAVMTAAGALLTAVAIAFAINLLVHGLVVLLMGAIFLAACRRDGRSRRSVA